MEAPGRSGLSQGPGEGGGRGFAVLLSPERGFLEGNSKCVLRTRRASTWLWEPVLSDPSGCGQAGGDHLCTTGRSLGKARGGGGG